ncbi:MAG TPA: NAD(P)-dependent alcohol dehydrogenase [Thermoanaerobaculia bacterium]|jgi:NADPH:quinone reductase-like Zn-dependent oxidoreductase
MRAVEIRGGFGLDHLALVERPDPRPGFGQILVRLRAASLNFRDLLTAEGKYNPKQALPLIPCSDGAGEVMAVGDGVTRVKPGDRVCTLFAQKWLAGRPTRERLRSTLGGPLDGTLAELAVFDQEGVVLTPAHLSDEEAATLPCAAVTAWSALVTEGGITAGDTVLVQGTGGVSLFALQIARLLGARVIATSSRDEKLARVREMGADETINYREVPAWGARAKELTGGTGVDHVIEVGGAGTLQQSLQAVRFGGTISLIGNLAGTKTELLLTHVFMQKIRLNGILVGDRESFEAMNRAIAAHRLRPVIDRVFPLEEAPAAFGQMAAGGHFGKICVRI